MGDDRAFTVESFTATDGYVWRCRRYQPPSAPRAHVVCIHGIQSHGGWYEHSCTRWSQAGFAVSFLDRRGSGLNEKDRGDTPAFRRLLDDVGEYLKSLDRKLPIFLVGISWGGKIVTALQRRHPGLTRGLVLLCPGFAPRVGPSFRERLGILWARFRTPTKLFPIPLSEPELFTANPKWQEFLRNDPLRLHQATARFLIESGRLDGYLRFMPGYVQMPVLLLLAGRDRIIDNARVRRHVARFATKDQEVIEYPEAHHTLEFEPDPERFIGDVQRWIEQRLG